MRPTLILLLIGLLMSLTRPLDAREAIRTEQLRFPPGTSGTTVSGSISGRDSVSYLVGAEAGQTMTVRLRSPSTSIYFNIYAPGRGPGDQALAVSGTTDSAMVPDINHVTAKLKVSGIYTISVYLVRAVARRGERARYTLEVTIPPASATTGARAPVRGDFADGLQGGPDYWQVTTREAGATVNLRAAPSTGAHVLRHLPRGTVLRNLGCRMAEAIRWCRVETTTAPQTTGWVAGTLLRESPLPAPARGEQKTR